MWRSECAFRPEQGVTQREADASGAWMDTADRSEAPRAVRARVDSRRRNGGDDEEADGEDAPPLAAAPGAGQCRAPECYWRDGATLRRRR